MKISAGMNRALALPVWDYTIIRGVAPGYLWRRFGAKQIHLISN
jgi:hypothetical protein